LSEFQIINKCLFPFFEKYLFKKRCENFYFILKTFTLQSANLSKYKKAFYDKYE